VVTGEHLDATCGYGTMCVTGETLAAAAHDPFFDAALAPALRLARRALTGEDTSLEAVTLAPADRRSVSGVDGFYVAGLGFDGYDLSPFTDGGLELPWAGVIGAFTADGLRAAPRASKVAPGDVVGEEPVAKGCASRKGATYAWAVRDRAEGASGLRAFVVTRCGLVPARDGEAKVANLQVLVYDAGGRLVVVASYGSVSTYEWGTDEGRAVIVGGRGLSSEGWRTTVRASRARVSQGLARTP
jgi:hypothetical protein